MSKNKKLIFKLLVWSIICSLADCIYAAEPSKTNANTVITSDRVEMESRDDSNIFNFFGNVHLEGEDLDAVCDKLEVITKKATGESSRLSEVNSFEKITGIGNVNITQTGRNIKAGHAVIFPGEGKVVLTENPQVIDSQGIVTGYKITFYKNDGKAYVEGSPGGERPKIILPTMPGPKNDSKSPKKDSVPSTEKAEKTKQQAQSKGSMFAN